MRSIVILNQTGCLLPLLIILNLFFGWMIFKPLIWLTVGLILTIFFLLNYVLASRKTFSYPKHKNVIDVEGKPVDDLKGIK